MNNTLVKNSGILLIKSKFFIYRAVSYASFLLVPLWIQKTIDLSPILQVLMMFLYTMFMVAQWFMLGKEIDHRFKIYFRINSSLDRIVYRLMLGMFVMVIYFNILNLLPSKWTYNCFWITWLLLGLFYSWPTRGKIIQESVTSNFNEFRYLDAFEKTLLGLIVVLFVVSMPELPSLTNNEALKLFFDPLEKFSNQVWSFLQVSYYPFRKYPALYRVAWATHFYLVGMGVFLITLYAVLRYFVSRRLSLLGVFALLSSWSFSKLLSNNYGAAITTTYSLLWIWSILWVAKSSSYRAGLFLGLVGYWGTVVNQSFSLLAFIQVSLLYFYFLDHKTRWFKRRLLRYSLLGLIMVVITIVISDGPFDGLHPLTRQYIDGLIGIIQRKAFYSLSFLGVLILLWKIMAPQAFVARSIKFDMDKILQLVVSIAVLFVYSLFFDNYLVESFAIMWMVVLLSVIPLELLFQAITRLRSRRNMIYVAYTIICLLDSHFEGRIKIFLRLFE